MSLKPIEVEVVLTPGLPTISILGLPDKIIQESAKRIQTALINQGYQMPKARQVLVNLWPRENKKSSLGLDLAIALGILHQSGQRPIIDLEQPIYGELDMDGRVRRPKDLVLLDEQKTAILTGEGGGPCDIDVDVLTDLKSIPFRKNRQTQESGTHRPPFPIMNFPDAAAELLKVIATGEHSVAVVGPPGTGKTSFVESLPSFLAEPNDQQRREIRKSAYYFSQQKHWRPVVKPHHSATALSFTGGGGSVLPGEIVRAHHGVLILDELLEFSKDVQSILREPMESGVLNLARAGRREQFDCKTLVLATSNLCPCGEYAPSNSKNCRCSSLQLRKYLQKLSGPFVDRFSVLQFTNNWHFSDGDPLQESEKILEHIQNAITFRKESRKQVSPNENLPLEQIYKNYLEVNTTQVIPQFKSKRREMSFLRVARTIADLQFSEKINQSHLEKSLHYTFFPFEEVKKVF